MARILVVMNAHALAHVSRPLEAAKILRDRGHEILFAGRGNYLGVAEKAGFEIASLPYISEEQLVEATRTQKLHKLFRIEQLEGFVDAELELYKRFKPDLVIVENRPTAITSAELAGIRSVGILNVHMSQYKEVPFNSLRNLARVGAGFPLKYTDRIENIIEGIFIDQTMMRDMAKLRRRFGLKKKHGFANEEGDFNLFPDIPEFSPVYKLPDNARYVGPLTWRNDLPPPACLGQIDEKKKCIYFTIGSSGLDELIENIQSYLPTDMPIIVATGAKSWDGDFDLPSNVYLEKYVNTETLLPRCDLVVCHGGNGTIYQALNQGVPVVGIAMHEEQLYGLKRVNFLELGKGFHIRKLRKQGYRVLGEAIQEVLRNEKYRRNAQHFQALLSQYHDSAERAADAIEDFLAH